jgi:hypothetical protein
MKIKFEKNKFIRFISVVAIVLGAFITIGTFLGNVNNYLYSNFFISKNISDKVTNLSAGQSINFFKQELGVEKIQRKISDNYTEYVFQYKSSFIQAVSKNDSNEVIYWAITDCGNDPIEIKRSTSKDKIFLNKSTIKNVFGETNGDFKYFIGNTANSFAYESLYAGNPSGYQTLIIGVNDICANDMQEFFNASGKNTQEQITKFRENGRINTYGETAPFAGDEINKLLEAQHSNDPYITFGVDRIKIRIFNNN